jgi:predicted lactoylglutathione lyase
VPWNLYRDGLDLPTPGIDEGIIAFELPNLSLFLIGISEYTKYVDRAGLAAPSTPAPGACIISCAIGTRAEVDDILARAAAAGGSTPQPAAEHDGSYTGYFSDPDGHLWELVSNDQTAAAAAQ